MELTVLDYLRFDFPSILLVCGLIVLMVSNRKNKLPAVFTLWIMAAIMVLSLFVEFICKCSEYKPVFLCFLPCLTQKSFFLRCKAVLSELFFV